MKLHTYKKLLFVEQSKIIEKNEQLVKKMPQHKCMLWLQYAKDWLMKQITHRDWVIGVEPTFENYEKYCLYLTSKAYKFLLDEIEYINFEYENTRVYM